MPGSTRAAVSKANRAAKRNSGRSRKGCAECKKRKIKCDEVQPQCGQCKRAGRSCSVVESAFRPHPYTYSVIADSNGPVDDISSLSVEHGASSGSFAHELAASTVGSSRNAVHSNVDASNSHPLQIPVDQTHPSHESMDLSVESNQIPPENAALATNYTTTNNVSYMEPASVEHYSAHADELLRISAFDDVDSDLETEEVAFLLRHFAEDTALCMDVFNPQNCFSKHALVLARESGLVKYALCAAAAKQIGHTKYPVLQSGNMSAEIIFTKLTTKSSAIDYLWYGAKYYGKAIQSMATELMLEGEPTSASSPEQFLFVASPSTNTFGSRSTEIRLVAATIMCRYEELSASWRAWARHLSGIHRFLRLDIADNAFEAGLEVPIPPLMALSQGSLQTVFWIFVQNDFEESFISMKNTRINPDNNALWQGMGLPLGEDGIWHYSLCSDLDAHDGSVIAFRAVLRLMCKLASVICDAIRVSNTPQSSVSKDRWTSHEEHTALVQEFHMWMQELPSSFTADIVRRRELESEDLTSSIFHYEAWYSSSICAISMLYYRMARILLLINEPSAPAVVDRLRSYRSLQNDVAIHAKDIISVALARPQQGVRSHLLQPLYVAGRCLTKEADQRRLVRILRGIEEDLGIATGYRVRALIEEWDSSWLAEGSNLDQELSDLSSMEEE